MIVYENDCGTLLNILVQQICKNLYVNLNNLISECAEYKWFFQIKKTNFDLIKINVW